MPLLLVTQINAGIYMVFGGPYVNRLFEVETRVYLRASVLATRQILSIVILIAANLLKRRFDMKMVTLRDWKYFFLCGTLELILFLGTFGIALPQYFMVTYFLSMTHGAGPFKMCVFLVTTVKP